MMKSWILPTLLTLSLAPGCGSDDTDNSTANRAIGTASVELSEDLQFLREEEKLARDVYVTLDGYWGTAIFLNIASSEQRHMDSVKSLLDGFGIDDPASDDVAGQFENDELAALYAQLVSLGSGSTIDAFVVGATIEDLDISDLEHMKARTDLPEVLAVYENLQCGSRNHLRSFVSSLEESGGSYAPQYITQAAFEEILGSAQETCSGN